jgi:DNA-3-methyladenine glycosylase II
VASKAAAEARTAAAIALLRDRDPVLRELIDRFGTDGIDDRYRRRPTDHYGALVRTITGQQLSTKAADAIYRRLSARFGGRAPTPEQILADDPEELRAAAGLSRAKVSFLRSLAEHVLDGSLELHKLGRLSDERVMQELVAVKGLGPWSAHMFLMFHLRRDDVLPVGDLGIRKAMMQSYGLAALPTPTEMEAIAEPWRPERTLACLFLWRSLDNQPLV